MSIKPVWLNYKEWEDYKNKMYENKNDKQTIKECYNILTNKDLKIKMKKTTNTYKISAKVNLTNKMFNPISWLGQATCNLLVGASAKETCRAWLMMTKEQQKKANSIAKEVIEEWRKENENL